MIDMDKIKYSCITEAKLSEYFMENFGKWKTKEHDKESIKVFFLNIFLACFIVAFLLLTYRPVWNFIEKVFFDVHDIAFIIFLYWCFIVIVSLFHAKWHLEEKICPLHEQESKEGYVKSKIDEYRNLLQFENILSKNENVRISTDRYETITAEWQDINGIWVKNTINSRKFYRDILTKEGLDFSWIDRKINEVLKENGFPKILLDTEESDKAIY